MALMKQVADILFMDIEQMSLSQPWKRAYYASRPVGEIAIQKYRVELADGSLLCTYKPPYEVRQLVFEASELREQAFPEKWYEMRLTIYPDKKCEVDFNYDPECLKKSFRD